MHPITLRHAAWQLTKTDCTWCGRYDGTLDSLDFLADQCRRLHSSASRIPGADKHRIVTLKIRHPH